MSNDQQPQSKRTTNRRQALFGAGALVAVVLGEAACGKSGGATTSGATAAAAPTATEAANCVLSPEVTEGPYWIDNKLTRRDITQGKGGLPLALHIDVVDAKTCEPVPGADVEIWHADARGVYSGFSGGLGGPGGGGGPNNSKRFLRGHQKADANGRVRFDTIYPGWYQGRSPHIHMKVHDGGAVVHTGQIFFADKTSRRVYGTSAYKSHGEGFTTNGQDSIYASAGASRARAKLSRRSSGGYRGEITVGIAT